MNFRWEVSSVVSRRLSWEIDLEVLELTCDSQPKRGGGQTQGSLRNALVVQCFETTDCNQLKDYLLWEAHIKSYFLIHYFQLFSNKSKTFGGKIHTSTKSLRYSFAKLQRKISQSTFPSQYLISVSLQETHEPFLFTSFQPH